MCKYIAHIDGFSRVDNQKLRIIIIIIIIIFFFANYFQFLAVFLW